MAFQESKLDRTVYRLPTAAKRSQKFNFEEIERVTQSRDFKDMIEASKHVVNTSRFSVIMLIYEKDRLKNADITV